MAAEIWTEKYFPASLDDFVGNSEVVAETLKWADAWDAGKRQPPLFLWGQCGAGKTCLAVVTARLRGWGLFELNASDLRTKEVIERVVGPAALNSSFSGARRLILLDEVDGLQAGDRGGAAAILSIMRESQNPVILTADDIYSDKKLAPMRVMSKALEFKKINYLSIAKKLRQILETEGEEYEEEAVKELARKADGDFRSALLDMQTLAMGGRITMDAVGSMGSRERQEKVFGVMKQIFKGHSLDEIRKARFSSAVNNDLLERWVEENIPRQYRGADIGSAFNCLSRADVFNGRIMRRQHYGFLRYSSELMSAGVALSRRQDYHDFVPYQFPQILSKLSKSSQLRAVRASLARKIGGQTHSSAKEVVSKDMPFIKVLAGDPKKIIAMTAQFSLDENEVAFLLDTKPSAKKVKDAIEKAAKLRAEKIAERRNAFVQLPKESDTQQRRLF